MVCICFVLYSVQKILYTNRCLVDRVQVMYKFGQTLYLAVTRLGKESGCAGLGKGLARYRPIADRARY